MNDTELDREERDLLDSYEQGEWSPVGDQPAAVERYRTYADATFKKDRRVNIRISSKVLEALQTIALQEGIPYQTLMSSVLHKYVNGRLIEKRRIPSRLATYQIDEEDDEGYG